MRVLFVSGTAAGGAARSTHELAAVMAGRGHDVATLMRDDDTPLWTTIHRRAVNLRVKLGARRSARVVDAMARRIGRRMRRDGVERPYPSFLATRPENAMARALGDLRPDVVVVNSIDLPAWRQVREDLRRRGVPVVLYVREETGLLHLSHSRVPPDLVIANAQGHVDGARSLGYDAVLVPSVVDCRGCGVQTTRRRVLLVNPTPMYGVDVALALARSRPDVPFTFAESVRLTAAELEMLERETAGLPNVVVRRFTPDPRALYADAKLLLAPYRYPGRSRVVAEAQCSGIPALGSNRYGLAEVIGDAGIVLDPDGPIEPWLRGLSAMWDDADAYDRLCALARARSAEEERQPATIAAKLERALEDVLGTAG
jgi:glycosyltransferase involved in cell wall biosynthesis